MVNYPELYFEQLEWNDKLAVAVSYELSLSFLRIGGNRCDPKTKIYCFDAANSIYDYGLKILMRKDFPLINELNQFILYASESGLINKWLMGNRSLTEKKPLFEYVSFKAESLIVALMIFIGMILLALIVIIVETIVHKKIQGQNFIPFWHYVEIMIDPYRHFLLEDLSH